MSCPPPYHAQEPPLPKTKLRTLLPTFTAFMGFLLSILLLFAGTQRQFLPQADLVTLNLPDSNPLGVPDFFKIYPLSYCEGSSEECITDETNTTSTVTTINGCSDRSILFSFDPGQAINQALDLPGNDPPDSINWPDYITDDFQALAPTTQAMSVFFVVGAATAGLTVLAKLVSMWNSPAPQHGVDPVPSTLEFITLFISFLTLGIASTIATVVSTQFIKLINKSGQANGISAEHGGTFLGLAWTAVALEAIGTAASLFEILMYRAKHCRCDEEPAIPASGSQEYGEEKPLVEGEC